MGAGALAACRFWPEEGLWNPCLAQLPRHLADHELVRAAWQGLDPASVWDSHAHLIGIGDSASGSARPSAMSAWGCPSQPG